MTLILILLLIILVILIMIIMIMIISIHITNNHLKQTTTLELGIGKPLTVSDMLKRRLLKL